MFMIGAVDLEWLIGRSADFYLGYIAGAGTVALAVMALLKTEVLVSGTTMKQLLGLMERMISAQERQHKGGD